MSWGKTCARELAYVAFQVAARGLPWLALRRLPWLLVASRALPRDLVASWPRGLSWPSVTSWPIVASRGLPWPPVSSCGLPWSPVHRFLTKRVSRKCLEKTQKF